MAYLLDAGALIEAKNVHYGFDFCPGFWEWIDREHQRGHVFSIEKVGDELAAGKDQLATWARGRGAAFFLPPAPTTAAALGKVATWVSSQGYQPTAVSSFLAQGADYFLVAQALERGDVVVSTEIASNSKKRVKIPDVCLGVGVKHVQLHEMLRSGGARLVLEP